MRRWLLVLLLVLLPLQLTWAAVGVYCTHERQPTAQHLGHHQHEHAASASGQAISTFVDVASVGHDCGVCHANCSVAFQTTSSLPNLNSVPIRSDIRLASYLTRYQDLPERPQWLPLA